MQQVHLREQQSQVQLHSQAHGYKTQASSATLQQGEALVASLAGNGVAVSIALHVPIKRLNAKGLAKQ